MKESQISSLKTKMYAGVVLISLIIAFACWHKNDILFWIFDLLGLVFVVLTFRQNKITIRLSKAEQQEQEEELKKVADREAAVNARRELIEKGIYPEYYHSCFDFETMVVVDTETTGTNADKDEMLQLSITDVYGNTLFDHYLKPLHRKTWEEAEDVNGISPEMVKDEKSIEYYADEIDEILEGKTIVGYNVDFDIKFLAKANLINDNCHCLDVMIPFAEIKGEYNSRYEDYRWQRLTTCARYYCYKWDNKAHNSLADCKATAYCFRRMCGRD